jgi:hypothetical protein
MEEFLRTTARMLEIDNSESSKEEGLLLVN